MYAGGISLSGITYRISNVACINYDCFTEEKGPVNFSIF